MSSGAPDYSYGIRYTPTSVSRPHPLTTLSSFSSSPLDLNALDAQGIAWIRVSWLDYANVLRYHVLSLPYFKQLMAGARPGIALGKMNLGAVHLTFVEGTNATGEWLYAFDAESLRVCPYAPGHASVMGFFQDKVPSPKANGGLGIKPIALCPRGLLKRVMAEAQEKAGLSFVVGVESEFTLLRTVDPPTTQGDLDYSTARRMPNGGIETKVMLEIADGLRAAGIEVLRRNPSETCEGEPSVAFEVLARNPDETCKGETANGRIKQANGTAAATNRTRECTCDAKKYRPAYELRDGHLERA